MTRVQIKEPKTAEELREALIELAASGALDGMLVFPRTTWLAIIDDVVAVAQTGATPSASIKALGLFMLTVLEKRIALDADLALQRKHVKKLESLGYWNQ